MSYMPYEVSYTMQVLADVVAVTPTELLLFLFAICVHTTFFGKRSIMRIPLLQSKKKAAPAGPRGGHPWASANRPKPAASAGSGLAKALGMRLQGDPARSGAESGISKRDDLCKEICKHIDSSCSKSSADVAQMLSDALEMLPIGGHSKKHPHTMSPTNGAELLGAVKEEMVRRSIEPDRRFVEQLLRGYHNSQLATDFDKLFDEEQNKKSQPPLSFAMVVLAVSSAVYAKNLAVAMLRLQAVADGWKGQGLEFRDVLPKFLQLAAAAGGSALITLLEYFSEKKLFAIPWVLENVLAECAQHGYTEGFSFVEKLAREQDLKLSAKVYCALVRGARNAQAATKVVDEVCANCANLDGILSCHNELLAAAFQKNCKNVLQLLDKLMAVGMKPNNVTCSILLKASDPTASSAILDRALGLVDAMDDDMDELLLVSVIEAHIRMGRSDLVRKTLRKQRASRSGLGVKSPQAFASLIRASSFLQDIEGIRAIWRDLRTRHVELTSLLVGCMVEGLVQNAGPDDGHELIREIIGDPNTRALVNAVIYGSVIKGFSHQKRFDKVWAVYTEAVRENVTLTIATYNCLMDACARCNENSHIPALLEEMGKSGIQPNIITYSAIIKGYCQENRVDRGLELLEEMRTVAKLTPDERIYNTIINGCARQCLYDKGMSILEQMMKEGVAPSNFTLSVLVKLAGRARHLDRAFELCTELKEKFGVQPNVHVYNNLIQACIGQKSAQHDRRGSCDEYVREPVKLLKRMADEHVRPDLRTYMLLIRALMMAGEGRQSVGLIRAAFGLDGIHPLLREVSNASLLQIREGLPADLMGEVFDGLVKGREPDLAPELFEELRRFPSSKFDAKAALKIISAASSR